MTSPAVVLGGIASRTQSIRLTSAVTVLSSSDPVQVFEDFTALDLLSNGRAEVMAGRGAFLESFPLYGVDASDQFAEQETVNWEGRFRPALVNQPMYPRPVQARLPIWIGVGGSPASFVRAGRLGVPMAIGIVGDNPAAFAPFVQLYRREASAAGHDPAALPIPITSHVFVGATSRSAADTYYPHYADRLVLAGRSPISRSEFDQARGLDGHLSWAAQRRWRRRFSTSISYSVISVSGADPERCRSPQRVHASGREASGIDPKMAA